MESRKEQMLADYRALGSYSAVAKKHGLTRQRVAQIVKGEGSTPAARKQDKKVARVLAEYKRLGTYRAVARELDMHHITVSRIVRDNLPKSAWNEAGRVALDEPVVAKSFYPTQSQEDFLKHQDGYFEFVREALDELLAAKDADKRIEDHLAYPHSSDSLDKGGGIGQRMHVYIFERQDDAMRDLEARFGRGTQSAAIRAAIDLKRGAQ